LLAKPLKPDDAVQLALLNNHALQASFQELGVSEADLVQSGRLPNPGFTWRHASGSGFVDIEETLTFNVLSLITAPYLHAAEQRRFAQVQDATVVQVVQLADRTRTAYYTAQAAHDSLQYAWQVKIAAETGAEIAHRMLGAGNWSRTDQYRQQNFYTQALQQLARAQLADDTARAELNRLLGIADGAPQAQLAPHLPALPENFSESPGQEEAAMQNRIDLKIMRAHMDELARRLKLTRATRMLNVLDAGPTRVREGADDAPHENGYELSFEVPIFDTGDARAHKGRGPVRAGGGAIRASGTRCASTNPCRVVALPHRLHLGEPPARRHHPGCQAHHRRGSPALQRIPDQRVRFACRCTR
jgi:outer membrane protein TolC